ncbi:hypothetical protein Bca4012_076249 [Brassica carinata]|uniref:Uncharacterized protein n=1 Tax=Brassica carinata TaxID=52824 RepID=A0A8X7QFA7_BRACI|nr:hypothetical protein Bca52824_073383 [Brassica carinata]
MPKVEFLADSIDPEEIDAYWAARGEVKPLIPGLWVPSPFKANLVAGCPSKSCPNGLAAIRRFYRVEEKIWEQWDPIPVSPDTVEAETGDPGEMGEVNQPVAPLDVNDYSIGRSMSGNFDLGD